MTATLRSLPTAAGIGYSARNRSLGVSREKGAKEQKDDACVISVRLDGRDPRECECDKDNLTEGDP